MIVLGLLLIVLAGAALIAVANDENGGITATITVLDRTLQLSKLELFLAGAATAAVFLIGLAGAVMVMRLMASMLFGVSANDPLTYVAVAAGLTGAALLACYVPAIRAAGLNPVEALRAE